ncbi:MAG TPA: sugar phosphate isomerase/epimerase [Pirellulales bacterium]
MRRISIGTWAFAIGPRASSPIPFSELVERIALLGFDGLELGGFGPHPNVGLLTTLEERQAARALWESRGMICNGLAADLWNEKLLTAPTNESYLAAFRQNLQFCRDLGVEVMRVDTTEDPRVLGPVGDEPPLAETIDRHIAIRRVGETWRQCAHEAQDYGVRVVWEPEPGFAFNAPSDVFRVIELVNHDNFGILFDTCHANMIAVHGARQPNGKCETFPGGVAGFARALKGKIGRIHLIDSNDALHEGRTSAHPPFGEGRLNFEEIMPALIEAGCQDDWWTVDLCYWPDAWTATEKCKRFMDGLNAKFGAM